MMKATMLASALAIAGLAGSACAQAPSDQERTQNPDHTQARPDQGQAQQGAISKQDNDFFEDAAQGGLLEVRLGQLAVKQAANEDVRKFAQRMIDDHTKLNNQLDQIGRKKGLAVPTTIERKHQDEVDKLAKESGDKFDKDYIDRMIDDHQNDIKAFEKQAKDGKDPELKALAASTLPTLRDHLTQAQQIQSRLKK